MVSQSVAWKFCNIWYIRYLNDITSTPLIGKVSRNLKRPRQQIINQNRGVKDLRKCSHCCLVYSWASGCSSKAWLRRTDDREPLTFNNILFYCSLYLNCKSFLVKTNDHDSRPAEQLHKHLYQAIFPRKLISRSYVKSKI